MNIPLFLEQENLKKNWSNEQAADYATIDRNRYFKIISGSVKPDHEDALKLSAVYQIPASLFLTDDQSGIYVNTGTGNYTNTVQGYIGTFNNSADEGLKELFKDLISALKPDLVWPEEKKTGQSPSAE